MFGVKKFDTKKRHGQTNAGIWFVIQAKAKKTQKKIHQLAFSTLGFGVKHPLKTPQREKNTRSVQISQGDQDWLRIQG